MKTIRKTPPFRLPALLMLLLLTCTGMAQGYRIDITVKPYRQQWLYLAYHYGNAKGLADSVWLDNNSRGLLQGDKPLPGGIYIVASPQKTILFEMLIPDEQHFSVAADTLDLTRSLRFTGSPENERFAAYTAHIAPIAEKAEEARQQLEGAIDPDEQKRLRDLMQQQVTAIHEYRKKLIADEPESMLASIFRAMQDPELPDNLLHPKTRADTLAQYRYAKDHYWDGVDFMDGRLVRTPIFEPKLRSYLNEWVVPDADSIIHEMNWMLALGRNDPEMFRFLIGYSVDNYMYPKIMGQDKVFLSVYERFIAGDEPKVTWLNERQKKIITDRAYMLMANQLGNPAHDMKLVDTAGVTRSLYDLKAPFTVISFWDPHCGKCREEMPRLDSIYKASWQKQGVQIYAVMVNEESVKDWVPYVRQTGKGWVHVHEPRELRDKDDKAGRPNFRQLYDMRSTPTLFLLDRDKRIIAKNLSLEDLHRVMQQRMQQDKTGKPS